MRKLIHTFFTSSAVIASSAFTLASPYDFDPYDCTEYTHAVIKKMDLDSEVDLILQELEPVIDMTDLGFGMVTYPSFTMLIEEVENISTNLPPATGKPPLAPPPQTKLQEKNYFSNDEMSDLLCSIDKKLWKPHKAAIRNAIMNSYKLGYDKVTILNQMVSLERKYRAMRDKTNQKRFHQRLKKKSLKKSRRFIKTKTTRVRKSALIEACEPAPIYAIPH